MCGRFATRFTGSDLVRNLSGDGKLLINFEPAPRYNIAPSQAIGALRQAEDQSRQVDLLRWGLVPHWSKGPDNRYSMHNARLEQIESKPSFRQAFARQRCLIPADGWYEWQARKQPAGKQACFIHRPGNELFCFAGLWDRWQEPAGTALESCTIITTAADPQLAEIHHRMPVVLNPGDYNRWLDPDLTNSSEVRKVLEQVQYEDFSITPVSRHVNNARNDDPRCTEPLTLDYSAE